LRYEEIVKSSSNQLNDSQSAENEPDSEQLNDLNIFSRLMHDEPVVTESEMAIYLRESRVTTKVNFYNFFKILNVELTNFS
jgi:hypothetical protein